MWKDVKKAFPDPNCPSCREGIELSGTLPTKCHLCGADRTAENWKEHRSSEKRRPKVLPSEKEVEICQT